MSCSPGRPRRGLGSPLGSFSRLLAGLDTGLGSLFRRLNGFAGGFYGSLGRGRSLLDVFSAPVHCLNAFLAAVQGLDGPALLTDRLGRLGNRIGCLTATPACGGLPSLLSRLFLRLFFRLFGCGFPLLDFLLELGDILLSRLNPSAALFIKLVNRFMGDVIHPSGKAVGRIFTRRAFLRIQAVVGLILGADICLLHPFRSNRRFINRFNAFFRRNSCFYTLAHGLHLLPRAGPPLFLQQLGDNHHPPVGSGILAGGKGNELVAVFRSHARVIERQFLALGNSSKSSSCSARTKW